MKLLYRNKILISGLYPIMKNFEIDEYIEKTGIYDDKIIDKNNKDYIFYLAGHLENSIYQVSNSEEKFYEFFENKNLFEIEVDENMSKYDIQKLILRNEIKKVDFLEEKLRLLTGLGITLPVLKIDVFYKDEFFCSCGDIKHELSDLSIWNYNNEMKNNLKCRLTKNINNNIINNLKFQNIRYSRAINFYNKSFVYSDIAIRFILLISALEALFNFKNKNPQKEDKDENKSKLIIDEVSKYSSKILFLSKKKTESAKWKFIQFYENRSNYIHGNNDFEITKKSEEDLREYVRKILLIYGEISLIYKISDPKQIIELLNKVDENNLNEDVKLFINNII